MVCVISLYLSECTRPNKKSSFSGTACKKKVPFQVLQGSRCELDQCRVFLGEVLPNLGECEWYPACALTQDFGRVICDSLYGPLEEDIDFTVLNCDLDSQHWRYDGQSKWKDTDIGLMIKVAFLSVWILCLELTCVKVFSEKMRRLRLGRWLQIRDGRSESIDNLEKEYWDHIVKHNVTPGK